MAFAPTFFHTRVACYGGYVVQALVNLYPPLLFVAFHSEFGLSYGRLTAIVAVNFCTQIVTDLLATPFVLRFGYRWMAVAAMAFDLFGILGLSVFTSCFASPYAGILAAMSLCAVGGGLMEVLVSPIVLSIPSKNKITEMNFLHSAYCWGCVLVTLVSVLLFSVFGIGHWRGISCIWAVFPVVIGILFATVPLATPEDAGTRCLGLRELFSSGSFALLLLLMLCAGASELAVSQWASFFAELGLGVSKATGDLLGPCAFAVLMGASRVWYGFCSERVMLEAGLFRTGLLCVLSYAVIVFSPWPVVSLCGCALCGLSVGIMWPGVFGLASKLLPAGGTLMFSLLAFTGDVGCFAGPGVIGVVSGAFRSAGRGIFGWFGGNPDTAALKSGMLAAALFPVVFSLAASLRAGKTGDRRARKSGSDGE